MVDAALAASAVPVSAPSAALAVAAINVGTGCSGMGAVFFALRSLGVPFKHSFASEKDAAARATLAAHAEPEGDFAWDINLQDVSTLPSTDLYVAGFPCQPFSGAGLREGFNAAGGLFQKQKTHIFKQHSMRTYAVKFRNVFFEIF